MTETRHAPMRVAIATVGCRANQADSSSLARYLDKRCVSISPDFDAVDITIINTCCVTAEAERDCRKLARRALKRSPDARVVFVGCAVNAIRNFGDELGERVEMRGGPDADPRRLASWIHGLAGASADDAPVGDALEPLGGRTRALIKIQNGCSHGCAYCIVPRARGRERSMPEAEVLDELGRLAAQGLREVVITGVQLGAWGTDLVPRRHLAELVAKAADRMSPGRLRLSSIEPWSVDDALIRVLRDHDRICPHLHLPIQSGDDGILRAMRRGYTARQYLDTIEALRRAVPDIAVGTDVLLGFPGEDDASFKRTLATLEAVAPAYVHAFSFSPRPRTTAARLPGRPPKEVVRERNQAVRELGERSRKAFLDGHAGRTREVIVEEERGGGWRGLTDTFVRVIFQSGDLEAGQLVRARLEIGDSGEPLVALPPEGV